MYTKYIMRDLCVQIWGKKYSELSPSELILFKRYNRRASYHLRHEENKTRQRIKKRDNKAYFIEMCGLIAQCKICGYNKSLAALDFHHRDATMKVFNIASGNVGIDKVISECKKCDLICSNCHRELHSSMPSIGAGAGRPSKCDDPIFVKFMNVYKKKKRYDKHGKRID
jgi:hypothetical protein